MDLNKRLEKVVEYLGNNQKAIAMEIGIGQTTFNKAVRGETLPRFDFFYALLNNYKNIDARWLMTGEGQMFENSEGTYEVGTKTENAEEPSSEYKVNEVNTVPDAYQLLYENERTRNDQLYREIAEVQSEVARRDMRTKYLEEKLEEYKIEIEDKKNELYQLQQELNAKSHHLEELLKKYELDDPANAKAV